MTTLRFSGPGAPRLDAWLAKARPDLAGGLLYKYHRQNRVKLNGKRRPLNTRLAPGDLVQLYLPQNGAAANAPPLAVLYEDENLLAANKPAGLLCLVEADDHTHSKTSTATQQDTLLSRIHHHLDAGGGPPGNSFVPQLCHRLDTGTSGIVLAAKTADALEWVTGLLRARALHKTYLGATVGHPAPPAGTIQGWLRKDAAQGLVRALSAPAPGAKPAETRYTTLATSGPLALVQLKPATGRTHQLRVHMATLGTPLLGDSKYGDNAQNRARRCKYQCLCALQLDFPKKIEDPAFARYAGLHLECPPPWFYGQLLEGELK